MWRLNNTLLNYTWIGEQISRDIKVYFAVNENKNKAYQICGMQEKLCLEGNL